MRLPLFVGTGLILVVAISWWFHSQPVLSDEMPVVVSEVVSSTPTQSKPPARVAKGIYLTAVAAANSSTLARMEDLIAKTELNTVVIDIKDYTGYLLYPSQVPLVVELKTTRPVLKDIPALIERLHQKNIYVIARQTVFQDPILAEKKPEWAFARKGGGLWRDHMRLAWVNPAKTEVWNYNLAIAREAIALGFDEVNFDYVRFPSDGDMTQVVYTHGARQRHEVMRDFYKYMSDALSSEPAWISVDLFGFAMERHDGMGIGQRLADTIETMDYISPMMYPSHYPAGHLRLVNPAAAPGVVIANGMKKGNEWFATTTARAQVRPWLQAFHIGAHYDAAKIRAQIDAVEKYPNAGWLLWNASVRYTAAGLKLTTSTL